MKNTAQWMESFKPIVLKYVGSQDISVVTGSYHTVIISYNFRCFLTLFVRIIPPQIIMK